MTREEARGITLWQLLYYMDEQDIFQVCFEGDGWDDYVELTRESRLLKPFMKCRIECMGAEFLECEQRPVIRISLDDKGMNYE